MQREGKTLQPILLQVLLVVPSSVNYMSENADAAERAWAYK